MKIKGMKRPNLIKNISQRLWEQLHTRRRYMSLTGINIFLLRAHTFLWLVQTAGMPLNFKHKHTEWWRAQEEADISCREERTAGNIVFVHWFVIEHTKVTVLHWFAGLLMVCYEKSKIEYKASPSLSTGFWKYTAFFICAFNFLPFRSCYWS